MTSPSMVQRIRDRIMGFDELARWLSLHPEIAERDDLTFCGTWGDLFLHVTNVDDFERVARSLLCDPLNEVVYVEIENQMIGGLVDVERDFGGGVTFVLQARRVEVGEVLDALGIRRRAEVENDAIEAGVS